MPDRGVVIIGKDAVAGSVKTRLGRSIGMPCAAEIHRLLGMHVSRIACASGYSVDVSLKGNLNGDFAQRLISLGATLYPQENKPLGDVIYTAMNRYDRVIVLGMDSPLISTHEIQCALERDDLCIGPAEDGGYWCLAASNPPKILFQDIPWSQSTVLSTTIQRAKDENLSPFFLQTHYDIDTLADLKRLLLDPNTPPPLSHSLQERIDHYARGSYST